MPRLRNTKTGVIVNVSDERVADLGPEYEPVDKPVARKRGKSADKE